MQWIAVSEQLPPNSALVIIKPHKMSVACGFYEDDRWYMQFTDSPCERVGVTHWMPLPEPPATVASIAKYADEH